MEKTKRLLTKLIEERRKVQYYALVNAEPENAINPCEIDEAMLEIRKYESFYRTNAALINERDVAVRALKNIRQTLNYAQSKIAE